MGPPHYTHNSYDTQQNEEYSRTGHGQIFTIIDRKI